MADISMCNNKNCKDKDTCYRFNAIPEKYYQSYMLIEGNIDKSKCDYYWKMKGVKGNEKRTNNK